MSGCLKPGCPRIAYLDPVFQTAGCLHNLILTPTSMVSLPTNVGPPTLSAWSLGVCVGHLKGSVPKMEAGRVGRAVEPQLVVEGGACRVWVNTRERVQHSAHKRSLWNLSPESGGQARQESGPMTGQGISHQPARAWLPGTHTSSAGWQRGGHWFTARTLTVRSNTALAQGCSLSKAFTCSFVTTAP